MSRRAPQGSTTALSIWGPLHREDLPGLYGRVCADLRARPAGDVACDVADLAADAVAVEALARLQLAAHRGGQRVVLRGASSELCSVVDLMGLTEVLTA
ncbi:MAG: STAS domain-containing protein [Solirubrobacteraceae bacterium]